MQDELFTDDITLNANLQETTHDLLELMRPAQLPNRVWVLMVMTAIPALMCAALITLPHLIFGSAGDNVYSQFASILNLDPFSFLPISLTSVCCGCGLFLPVRIKVEV